ncbi:MAG: hypothetical protein IT285_15320 [Bdellovibrionales bacterium]|nr:hypothetical protein [Bdellovibrionales bacterium]
MFSPSRLKLVALLSACLLTGCVAEDETTSLYVASDGTIEVVTLLDRVSSQAKEATERAEDEKKWKSSIEGGTSIIHDRLKRSGASNLRTQWLRESVPYAWAMSATLKDPKALGRYLNLDEEDGSVRLEKGGKKRRLVFSAREKKAENGKAAADAPPSPAALMPYPVIRVVPAPGKVVGARGFKIGPDGHWAAADLKEIDRISTAAKVKGERYELWVEWLLP